MLNIKCIKFPWINNISIIHPHAVHKLVYASFFCGTQNVSMVLCPYNENRWGALLFGYLKCSSVVICRRKKVFTQVWNDVKVHTFWMNFHFLFNYLFKGQTWRKRRKCLESDSGYSSKDTKTQPCDIIDWNWPLSLLFLFHCCSQRVSLIWPQNTIMDEQP